MTVDTPPPCQHTVRDAVATDAHASPQDAPHHAPTLLAAERVVEPPVGREAPADWATRFRRWAEGHRRCDRALGRCADSFSCDGVQ